MKQNNLRLLACKAVMPILEPNKKSPSLDNRILQYLPKINSSLDRSFFKNLCYNMCRWHNQLTAISTILLKKPLKKNAFDIQLSINIGLLQLLYLDIDEYAALKESVELAGLFKKPWAKGLINAVLREAQRQGKEHLLNSIEHKTNTKYAHPDWIIQLIQKDWPQSFHEILSANNTPGPLTLRINTQKISREDYLKILTEAKIEAYFTSISPYGITLRRPYPVKKIPLFTEGIVTIQDEAAQLAAHFLMPKSSETILDACAAPGGKSTHIVELAPKCQLIANDINEQRISLIVENFQRLGITATTTCCDLRNFKQLNPFSSSKMDSILLDAPCSGLGVIRRHPDIKWLRTEGDIKTLATVQYELLESAWEQLKIGGKLLYSTCSILRSENEGVITRFLKANTTAKVISIDTTGIIPAEPGYYLLPSKDGHDGFYFALLEKLVFPAKYY